jgi:nucleoside-diphosphate-sugar epimerase
MKVLVTGAAGFVGAQVVRALVRRGDTVYAAIRASTNRRRLDDIPSVHTVEADFATPEGRAAIASVGADVVVHAAWFVDPATYLSSLANLVVLGATLELARELAQAGLRRFVGVGTCFEYDTRVGYLTEDVSPLSPGHLYSAAKASAYLTLKQIDALTGMRVAWVRLFYLYGPDEYPRRLVPSISRALVRGEEARSTAGDQVRDFLHVEDAGAALAAVVHSDIVGAVNVASGQPVTIASMVRELGSLSGRPDLVRLGALPYSSGDPMFVCANVRKLVDNTDFKPRWSLHDGLNQALEWWRTAEQNEADRRS